jgi:hypothetical protein
MDGLPEIGEQQQTLEQKIRIRPAVSSEVCLDFALVEQDLAD